MFNIGEYVIYGRNICKVKDIKDNKYNKESSYVLVPIDDDSLTIDVPAENRLNVIKKILTKEQALELINKIHNIDDMEIINEKMIEYEYKKLIDDGTKESLIKVIKSTYLRNEARKSNKKKISDKENSYFKLAEKILFNELSIALNMSYDDTKKYVIEQVERNINNEE